MRQIRLLGVLFVMATTPLAAQQVGDADRDYVVNGQGSLVSSPVNSIVVDCASCPGWVNQYSTQDPAAPIAMFIATEGQVGWYTTATNSVDVGPGGLTPLLDGFDPFNPVAPFLKTDGGGDYVLTVAYNPSLAGASSYFAMAHLAGTSPDGFWISQTHNTTWGPANALGSEGYAYDTQATVLSLDDDDNMLVNIGFDFSFYGVTYSQCYVGSNGYVTFGIGDSDPGESLSDMQNGPRRIAGWWDDLNPQNTGVVAVRSTFSGLGPVYQLNIYYHAVPEFTNNSSTPGIGANTFSIQLRRCCVANWHSVRLNYESMTSIDGIVGITPGASSPFLPATVLPLDLSLASATGLSVDTGYYEQFTSSNPIDVVGHRVVFELSSSGQPVSQY